MKILCLFIQLLICTQTACAKEQEPHFDPKWKSFYELGHFNPQDFAIDKKKVPAILIRFKNQTHYISVFLNDATEKYFDKKFQMNMTILLTESSSSFKVTPTGSLSQDIYFGENFRFPKSEEDLTKVYIDKIIDSLSQSLARNEPGFLWKNKNEAIEGLGKMQLEKKAYTANIWKYRRNKNGGGGGIMEFEILTNPENKISGYRITEELIID
jgi:hypothetical protein